MEAKERKVPVSISILTILIFIPVMRLLPNFYWEAIPGWKTGVLGVAFIFLAAAYYLFFAKRKRAIAIIMAAAALVAILAFIFTLPGHTIQQATKMLREEVPGLESAELMENEYEQLITVREYVISFQEGDEVRNFIVDPDTLDYFEEDNVLLWYGQNY